MSRKAKLNNVSVQEIRISTHRTQKELAKEYGVSLLTIWKVKNFKGTYANNTSDVLPMLFDETLSD